MYTKYQNNLINSFTNYQLKKKKKKYFNFILIPNLLFIAISNVIDFIIDRKTTLWKEPVTSCGLSVIINGDL